MHRFDPSFFVLHVFHAANAGEARKISSRSTENASCREVFQLQHRYAAQVVKENVAQVVKKENARVQIWAQCR